MATTTQQQQPQAGQQDSAPRPEAQRMGFDITRPFRYGAAGVKGTFTGFLDGMSTLGRKGFWTGAGIGIIAALATGGFGYILMFALGGLVAGAAMGAVGGGVMGGVSNVSRSYRREKYADELAERQTARAARESRAPTNGYHARNSYDSRQGAANYNFERALQQERENDRDYNRYWQDRVENSHNGHGRGF